MTSKLCLAKACGINVHKNCTAVCMLLYPHKEFATCNVLHADSNDQEVRRGAQKMQATVLFLSSSFFNKKNIITLLIFTNREKAG